MTLWTCSPTSFQSERLIIRLAHPSCRLVISKDIRRNAAQLKQTFHLRADWNALRGSPTMVTKSLDNWVVRFNPIRSTQSSQEARFIRGMMFNFIKVSLAITLRAVADNGIGKLAIRATKN